jgi:extradiol dioxygenase family protein
MSLSPFHLAIPVYDLEGARHFYREVFGLEFKAFKDRGQLFAKD